MIAYCVVMNTNAHSNETAARIADAARKSAEHLANEAIGRGKVAVKLSGTASGTISVSTSTDHRYDVLIVFDKDGAAYSLDFCGEQVRGYTHTLAAVLRKRFVAYALGVCPATVRRWEAA